MKESNSEFCQDCGKEDKQCPTCSSSVSPDKKIQIDFENDNTQNFTNNITTKKLLQVAAGSESMIELEDIPIDQEGIKCYFCIRTNTQNCSTCPKTFCENHGSKLCQDCLKTPQEMKAVDAEHGLPTQFPKTQLMETHEGGNGDKNGIPKLAIGGGVILLLILVLVLTVFKGGSAEEGTADYLLRDFKVIVPDVAGLRLFAQAEQNMILPPYIPDAPESRYLAHVSTDKPFYKPNEVVFVEVFIIDALTKQPMLNNLSYDIYAQVTILNSFKQQVFQSQPRMLRDGTVVINDWRVPIDQYGGEFDVKVSIISLSVPDSFRKIRIGTIAPQELFVTLDFDKNAYSPKEQVVAKIKVRRPDGQKLEAGSSVALTDGANITLTNVKLNNQGETNVTFVVPASAVNMTVLTISVSTYQGYTQENGGGLPFVSSFSVPILDNSFEVVFSPEYNSAGLVPDLLNRLYFQVLTKPVDNSTKRDFIEFEQAVILDTKNAQVARTTNMHNGRSFIEFTPRIGTMYFFQLQLSKGGKMYPVLNMPLISNRLEATALIQSGYVYSFENKTIKMVVQSNQNFFESKGKPLSIEIRNKEKVLFSTQITLANYGAQSWNAVINLEEVYAQAPNGGVMIFKCFDTRNTMNSVNLERLIYLKPKLSPVVEIKTDKLGYRPGEKVKLSVSSNLPEAGSGAKYFASVKVTDLSSFLKVPSFKQMPNLINMVYLEKEVKHLNGAINEFNYWDEYLTNSTKLDLLLATQTWRRGLLDNMDTLNDKINGMEWGSDEQLQLEYLQAKKAQQIYIMRKGMFPMANARGGDMMEAMPMAAEMAPAPAPMPKIAVADAKQQAPTDVSVPEKPDNRGTGFDPVVIGARSFQHALRRDWTVDSPRIDFTQTLLFQSAQRLKFVQENSQSEIESEFFLNDQVSTFQIEVNVFSSDGNYGYAKQLVTSNKLVYSKFTLPETLVQGDSYSIPITISNNIDQLTVVTLDIEEMHDGVVYNRTSYPNIQIAGLITQQWLYRINSTKAASNITLNVKISQEGRIIDTLIQTAKVILNGFPDKFSQTNILTIVPNADITPIVQTINLPPTMVGKPKFRATLYTTTFDSILDAVKSLIQKPYGCFEQTSATTYPMVMALQLLKEIKSQFVARGDKQTVAKIDKMEEEIKANLKEGYTKLIGFETSTKGYEWFGTSPGHEALTGYGLSQFAEMKTVVDFVDDGAIKRNSDWLMSRRNGVGQFNLNQRALDTFGRATQDVTDVYILWVLSSLKETTYDSLKPEFQNLQAIAARSNDPYILSLSAGALWNVDKTAEAKAIATRLQSFQNQTGGELNGAATSITSSSGQNLITETTSLAVLAWLNIDSAQFGPQIELAVNYLMKQVKDGGRYGSTQATVLSLKALVKYAQIFGGIKGQGKFVLYLNDNVVQQVNFNEADASTTNIDFSDAINSYAGTSQTPLTFRLSLEQYKFNAKNEGFRVSYLLSAEFINSKPPTSPLAPISFYIEQDKPFSAVMSSVGSIQKQTIHLIEGQGKAQGMAVAIISVPSCMVVEQAQLELLRDTGKIDNYQVSADNTLITLYWTYLKANQHNEIVLSRSLVFGGPGATCLQRPSQAYLYYNDSNIVWTQ